VEGMNAMDTCLRRYDIRKNAPEISKLGSRLRGNDGEGMNAVDTDLRRYDSVGDV